MSARFNSNYRDFYSYILSGDLFGTGYPFLGGEENVPRLYDYRCDIRTGLSIASMTKISAIQMSKLVRSLS